MTRICAPRRATARTASALTTHSQCGCHLCPLSAMRSPASGQSRPAPSRHHRDRPTRCGKCLAMQPWHEIRHQMPRSSSFVLAPVGAGRAGVKQIGECKDNRGSKRPLTQSNDWRRTPRDTRPPRSIRHEHAHHQVPHRGQPLDRQPGARRPVRAALVPVPAQAVNASLRGRRPAEYRHDRAGSGSFAPGTCPRPESAVKKN